MFSGNNGPGSVELRTDDRALATAAVRALLRSADTSEDALIARFAATALSLAESFTGRVLIAREMTVLLPAVGGWQRLGAVPVRAITAVARVSDAGSATLLASDGYAIDIDAEGEGWVRVAGAAEGRISITFEAGQAAGWDALPPPIAQGVVLLAAHLFEGHGGDGPPPAAVAALWRPWRRMALGPARRTA